MDIWTICGSKPSQPNDNTGASYNSRWQADLWGDDLGCFPAQLHITSVIPKEDNKANDESDQNP